MPPDDQLATDLPPWGSSAVPTPRGSAPTSTLARFGFLLVAAVVGAALAVPAAWLWSKVADPPQAALTRDGWSLPVYRSLILADAAKAGF